MPILIRWDLDKIGYKTIDKWLDGRVVMTLEKEIHEPFIYENKD